MPPSSHLLTGPWLPLTLKLSGKLTTAQISLFYFQFLPNTLKQSYGFKPAIIPTFVFFCVIWPLLLELTFSEMLNDTPLSLSIDKSFCLIHSNGVMDPKLYYYPYLVMVTMTFGPHFFKMLKVHWCVFFFDKLIFQIYEIIKAAWLFLVFFSVLINRKSKCWVQPWLCCIRFYVAWDRVNNKLQCNSTQFKWIHFMHSGVITFMRFEQNDGHTDDNLKT